ncbi:hydrogenase maturation protease [Synechococcus sp. Tobar12-5m-g]|uniref:hydrogenase maturation protease n=1 Tax=Synechococcus sp. Cruz CV-v-12 TaxID=2823728 RepID=UPI0020CD6F5E|nr:hydrogenase maturation protease [Synechococcus sp. Cruz CV-v-12]MCP9773205.1 hydrogenase maturation protease [Synechococcus sp. Tobar12-5m-g]MCP9874119.1 hydrogenase maturation protease [Synechococcus sp. Cruz CV-v-12]
MAAVSGDLLIGWGNGLRQDDGVGRAIAAEVERWELPSLAVIERTQLTPELAPQLAAARRVLFVDAEAEAAAGPGGWRLEPLLPPESGGADAAGPAGLFSHHASTGTLLQLAETLYGRRPPAWQLLVAAHGCGFSTRLTLATRAVLPEVLAAVRRWCGDA